MEDLIRELAPHSIEALRAYAQKMHAINAIAIPILFVAAFLGLVTLIWGFTQDDVSDAGFGMVIVGFLFLVTCICVGIALLVDNAIISACPELWALKHLVE